MTAPPFYLRRVQLVCLKVCLYRHRHFASQVRMLQEAFSVEPGGVSIPTFPPFALFDPALGLTSVIPDMDPRQPANANPKKLLHAIEIFQATQLFGSPALMNVLANYGKPLISLRCVISAGAPVPAKTVETIRDLLWTGSKILDTLRCHRMFASGCHRW